jgi:hypothetical protein
VKTIQPAEREKERKDLQVILDKSSIFHVFCELVVKVGVFLLLFLCGVIPFLVFLCLLSREMYAFYSPVISTIGIEDQLELLHGSDQSE